MLDERMEQLISRKLDGELSDAESLELDKLLIRSPEGRAFLEEQEKLDWLARDSLRTVLGGGLTGQRMPGQTPLAWPCRSARREHLWYGGIGLAAGFALTMLLSTLVVPLLTGRPGNGAPPVVAESQAPDTGQAVVAGNPNRNLASPLGDLIDLSDRAPGQLLGVYDDQSRSLYLLEMGQAPFKVVPAHMNY